MVTMLPVDTFILLCFVLFPRRLLMDFFSSDLELLTEISFTASGFFLLLLLLLLIL